MAARCVAWLGLAVYLLSLVTPLTWDLPMMGGWVLCAYGLVLIVLSPIMLVGAVVQGDVGELAGGLFWLTWLANPLLCVVLLRVLVGTRDEGRDWLAPVLAGAAVLAAVASPVLFALTETPVRLWVSPAYQVWLASMLLGLVAALLRALEAPQPGEPSAASRGVTRS